MLSQNLYLLLHMCVMSLEQWNLALISHLGTIFTYLSLSHNEGLLQAGLDGMPRTPFQAFFLLCLCFHVHSQSGTFCRVAGETWLIAIPSTWATDPGLPWTPLTPNYYSSNSLFQNIFPVLQVESPAYSLRS